MREAVDLAKTTLPGGFFVLNGRKSAPYHNWLDTGSGDYVCVGTYRDSGSPLRDAILKAIREAQRKVFVASFLIGDEAVTQALLEAADRLRGGVYVITALDERSLERGMQDYQDDDDTSDEGRRKQFERLTTKGVYVRGHESCHAKFVVIDESMAIVGSANLVAKAFEWTGEANVVVRNQQEVRQIVRLFAELWHGGCIWEIPPGSTYTVSQRAPTSSPIAPRPPACEPGNVVWTNGAEQGSLLSAIHKVIDSSRSRLTIATYSLCGMTGKRWMLIDPIEKAIRRGVKTRLFIRQRNAFPRQSSELECLHDLGVEVLGDLRNHAKAVIADGKHAVVFSANFDAQHGLDSGVEVGVYLPSGTKVVTAVDRYLQHAIENADVRYVRNPSQADLDGILAARWCSPCLLPKKLTVKCSPSDWLTFREATESGPVLFEITGNDPCRLIAGDNEFHLVQDGSAHRLQPRSASASSAETLRTWLGSARQKRQDEVKRGFCVSEVILESP